MKYHEGDKFLLEDIECYVGFVNAHGKAYLIPKEDGGYFGGEPVRKGVVFAILGPNGRDKHGIRATPLPPASGAV